MWLAVFAVACGSRTKARAPADAAPVPVDASPPSTEFLAVVTAPEHGLAPACVDGKVVPALAAVASELDCRGGPVTAFREATVRGHHVVFLLDAAGDMRGRFDGKPLDKIRLDEGPVVEAFPPEVLSAFTDAELGDLLAILAGVAMINPPRRIGYTAGSLEKLRADWPQQPIAATPPAVVVERDRRSVRLWYEVEKTPGCVELWWSDVWIDRTGTIDQLTHEPDEKGATCPVPPPPDPDRGNFFPD